MFSTQEKAAIVVAFLFGAFVVTMLLMIHDAQERDRQWFVENNYPTMGGIK